MYLLCSSCNREIIQPDDVQKCFVEDKHTKQCTCNKYEVKFSSSNNLTKHLASDGYDGKGIYHCRLCQELESTEPTAVLQPWEKLTCLTTA